MCGIVGIVNIDGRPVDAARLKTMRDLMTHRGPDDQGLFVDTGVGLAHRRLSILDLTTAGHQPMPNEDESLWLVFNGEIYNFVELAKELKQKGHRFRSNSDSEVILHLYEEYGPACVDHLNGMFAFAIWDREKKVLFAARDRMGIKPFYYFWNGVTFVFASEAKSILAHPDVPREPNPQAIADYMFCGQTLDGRTFFSRIMELPPARALSLERGHLRDWEYWRLSFDDDGDRRDADVIEEAAALLDDAVKIHCRSDAKLGCHLSGGLDSSTIAALTTKHRGSVKSFSIRSPGGARFDETPYAKTVSNHVGTEYFEATADAMDVARLTPKLLWHMDMPMPTAGGVNYFKASQLAAQHVKVSLTGHGGDEVFAGYPAQFRLAFGTTSMFDLSQDPMRSADSWFFRLRKKLQRDGVRGLAMSLGSRLQTTAPPSPEAVWMQLHCGHLPSQCSLLDRGFVSNLNGYTPEDDYLEAFRIAPTDELLNRCVHHDLRCYLPSLLHMEDSVSMAVSLESRVPLLDYRIVEFAARIPPAIKVKDRIPKRLLREAAKRWLPDKVIQRRDKAGFHMPAARWLKCELAVDLQRILGSVTSRRRGVFESRIACNPSLSSADAWKALNVELWFRIFIDQDVAPDTPLCGIT